MLSITHPHDRHDDYGATVDPVDDRGKDSELDDKEGPFHVEGLTPLSRTIARDVVTDLPVTDTKESQ
jgi:hypothetical protein